MKQQLVNLTTRCDNFEKKSFSLNRFKNDKSMGFYTGFADGEIFHALYNFCDSGEHGENIFVFSFFFGDFLFTEEPCFPKNIDGTAVGFKLFLRPVSDVRQSFDLNPRMFGHSLCQHLFVWRLSIS